MKAESGGWFYIILSIVFIIISAVGKNKKKVTSSTPPINDPPVSPEDKKWPKTLEDILSEVLDVPKPQEVVIPSEQPPVILDGPVNRSQEPQVEYKEPEIKTPAYKSSISFTEEQPEMRTKSSKKPAPAIFEDALDMRQGIIYAEILNRKYF